MNVFWFFVVSAFLTPQIHSQEDTVEQLKLSLSTEILNRHEKFIISFQEITPAQILYPKNNYQQYMAFSSKYNSTLKANLGKFAQLHSVDIAYLSVHRFSTLKPFYNFCLRPNTVFILLIDCLYAGKPCTNPEIPIYT